MSEFIIISLFVVAAVVAWAWLRRRHVVGESQADKPAAEKEPSVEKSQAGPVTDAKTPASARVDDNLVIATNTHSLTPTGDSAPSPPHESPQPKPHSAEPESIHTQTASCLLSKEQLQPCTISAIVHIPATPPLTSPEVTFPATDETTAYEQNSAIREPEQIQPKSAPPPDANLGRDDVSVPSEASEREPLVAEAKTPSPVLEAAIPAGELPTQPVATDENLGELGAPLSTTTATMSVVSPPTRDEAESEAHESPEPPLVESESPPKVLTYHPLTPPAQKPRMSGTRERTPHSTPKTDADLRLHVQLMFGRGGIVKTLVLVADRREGMPSNVEVKGTHGELCLTELNDNYYVPLTRVDAGNTLQQGVEWRGRGDASRWRWVLGGRELYVLAPGDEFGLNGFISTSRLWLNARHVVIAKASLRDQVLTALTAAGCATPEVSDDAAIGVPSGWVLFRDVTPTRAMPMRDEQDILNVLCPAHEIEPHFVGGIRLERNIWLAGFPPRIRFTGELGDGFQVMIDGQAAQPASDGAFEAPGWDTACEHRLWFGDRFETYSLRTMEENWGCWHAHDFGTGAAICGAATHRTDGGRYHQVRIPAANPLLLGARPGEIFCCQAQHDVRSETIIVLVPFAPVWALPMDPVHADKRYARLMLLDSIEPVSFVDQANRKRDADRAFRQWIAAINDTGRKQLALAVESEDTKALWRRYRVVAKHFWRKMR